MHIPGSCTPGKHFLANSEVLKSCGYARRKFQLAHPDRRTSSLLKQLGGKRWPTATPVCASYYEGISTIIHPTLTSLIFLRILTTLIPSFINIMTACATRLYLPLLLPIVYRNHSTCNFIVYSQSSPRLRATDAAAAAAGSIITNNSYYCSSSYS